MRPLMRSVFCAVRGRGKFRGQRRVAARIDRGHPGQRGGDGGEHAEDRVKLGRNGKLGQTCHPIPLKRPQPMGKP